MKKEKKNVHNLKITWETILWMKRKENKNLQEKNSYIYHQKYKSRTFWINKKVLKEVLKKKIKWNRT